MARRGGVVMWALVALAAVLLAVGGIAVFLLLTRREVIEVTPTVYAGNIMGRHLTIDGINHGLAIDRPALQLDWGRPDKDFSRLPSTYYHPHGPLGLVLRKFDWFAAEANTFRADARLPASLLGQLAWTTTVPLAALVNLWSEPPIGALDLTAGTVAAYARPYQCVDFYESNPLIKDLSFKGTPTPAFTFVHEARKRGANVQVIMGPERQTLADKGPDGFYHVLVVETARGHSDRPDPLRLTRDALELYLKKTAPGGVICIHVSSRRYNFAPFLGAAARSLGLEYRRGHDVFSRRPGTPIEELHFSSEWVMVARTAADLSLLDAPAPPGFPAGALTWTVPAPAPQPIWTDQHHNLGAAHTR